MRTLSLVLLIAFIATAPAADTLPPEIAPYIDEQTVALGRIDLNKIDVDALFKQVEAIVGKNEALPAAKQQAAAVLTELKKGGVSIVYVTVNMADFGGNPTCVIVPLPIEADANKVAMLTTIPGVSQLCYQAKNGTQIFAERAVIERIKSMKPAARPDLAAALAQGKDATVHVAVAVTADLRRVAEETMPNLPKEVGGGSIQLLTRGLIWATVSVDLAAKPNASLMLQASDAAAAKNIEEIIRNGAKTIAVPHNKNAVDEEKTMRAIAAKLLAPVVDGNRVSIHLDDKLIQESLAPMVLKMRAAAERTQSMNNLKQLALAMHVYADSHGGRFPENIVDKDGKPLLSWRVHLLPYLEQDALYKQFKLDESWDSEHNKKLIAKIPATFIAKGQKSAAGTTTYLGPLGEGYLFRPKAKEGLKIHEIADGSSNTIMIVEAADSVAVEWTKPADWTPDEKEIMKGLIGHYPQGFSAAFCDGSVQMIGKGADAKTVRAMLTTAGGEEVKR